MNTEAVCAQFYQERLKEHEAEWLANYEKLVREAVRKEILQEMQAKNNANKTPLDNQPAQRNEQNYPVPADTEPENRESVEESLVNEEANVEKDEHGLKILRHLVAKEIVRRQPQEIRDTYYISDEAVFCYVEVASVYDTERQLLLRWTHSSGISQSYELPVGQSPAWRTWSKLNLTHSMIGQWLCEVYNEDGALLGSINFEVASNEDGL